MTTRSQASLMLGGLDHFDVGAIPVLGTEIEHLLRLANSTDIRAGDATTLACSDPKMFISSGLSGKPTYAIVPSVASNR